MELKGLKTDEASQKRALGPLYKKLGKNEEKWPIVEKGNTVAIDMRLFSWKALGHDDELTPAARIISSELRKNEAFSIGLVACSGSGKTSGIFSLAHEHHLVYMDAGGYLSDATVGHVGRRPSIWNDDRYPKLIGLIQSELGLIVGSDEACRVKKLAKAIRLFKIEFLTR